ncbi:MAG: hypothetical protein R3185_02860 [Candidatus Thermoplasmatota archaeon]|nr:hypothetical protein [Candidatus Thermoplasmatota archaeon]
MRLFARDTDNKPDTPLSFWLGILFIASAVGMKAAKIGPGPLTPSWEFGMPAFILVTGLVVLIPGVLLTLLKRPE